MRCVGGGPARGDGDGHGGSLVGAVAGAVHADAVDGRGVDDGGARGAHRQASQHVAVASIALPCVCESGSRGTGAVTRTRVSPALVNVNCAGWGRWVSVGRGEGAFRQLRRFRGCAVDETHARGAQRQRRRRKARDVDEMHTDRMRNSQHARQNSPIWANRTLTRARRDERSSPPRPSALTSPTLSTTPEEAARVVPPPDPGQPVVVGPETQSAVASIACAANRSARRRNLSAPVRRRD